MKVLKVNPRNPGDGKVIEKEEIIKDFKFNTFKFNSRPRPSNKEKIIIVTNFFEFGCESISLMFCLPKILQKYPGSYVICVGWYGREYLYRHIADEYWEIPEDMQWLREYSNAFDSNSKNIKEIEKKLKEFGRVIVGKKMNMYCMAGICRSCGNVFNDEDSIFYCKNCNSLDLDKSILHDIRNYRKKPLKIPKPSQSKIDEVKKYLRENSVGIFARGRQTYGRNLSEDFYIKLIKSLLSKGYNPIWLGEKQSVQPCPIDGIIDFSRMPEARDLELTLAIISQLEFTIQFWTASTRLASMMETPWILFESPEQIYGDFGQEGKRIYLCTKEDKKKIVLAQFHDIAENTDLGIQYVEKAIDEINQNNWSDLIGPVKHPEIIKLMMKKREIWI